MAEASAINQVTALGESMTSLTEGLLAFVSLIIKEECLYGKRF